MKLLLFAHTPPPHHGQSVMVELMLKGLGGDQRLPGAQEGAAVACYHVNARFSDGMDDIGKMRGGKALRLLGYIAEALWCRFRHGVRVLYYVPAPGKRSALYRDWVMLLCCRPFFTHRVMHWHAVGLEAWLGEAARPWERAVTHWLYGGASLSISLTESNRSEAAAFEPKQVAIVPNGIPDPCPDYAAKLAPERQRAARARQAFFATGPNETGAGRLRYRLLFMGHCTREKGLFDTLEAVALINADPASRLQVELRIAGHFVSEEEEREVRARMAEDDLATAVEYVGFAGPERKAELLSACDALCFPGYYHAESFGLVMVEAMAFGAAVIATRWRAAPELLPAGYPGLVNVRAPQEIAALLPALAAQDLSGALREHFEANFTVPRYIERLRSALLTID